MRVNYWYIKPMIKTVIRKLEVNDWQLYKSLRISALQDSPEAFGSSYELEISYKENKWKTRLKDSTIFVAFSDDAPVGLVGSFTKPERPTERMLFSMWVDPDYRDQKIGDQLVRHFISWSKSQKATKIIAGISDENIGVFNFYEKLGFKKTGEKVALMRNSDACEIIISLNL